MELQPIAGGPPINRVFRLKRETPVEWFPFQPQIFEFAFAKHETDGAVCVINLWQTLVVAVTVPWPDKRGPLRKGKNNPFSRDAR
jgi:hypothetical protein